VIDYNRSPNKLTLAMAQNTGSMRMKYEADSRGNIALRRLRAGERQSWDDGTINMVCWVPWSIGGCKCSDRWGVKVGRFQTLLGIDDAWDYIPGFSFVMRAQGSYRAFDVAGAMGRAWMDDILPESANLERGVWESNRAEQFYKFTGVQVNHVYSPNHKLVEPLWGRLWTEMSLYGGQVGRYRGEMERENALLMKCQAGTQDPRQCFPSLLDALNAIERGLLIQNSEPKESRKYGKWIPQERYAEQLAERPRKALDREMSWLLAPEVHRWKVKRNGVVGGQVRCPLGPSIPYYFACDHLWDFIGARVDVHFDPYLSPIRATITLAEPHRGRPAGTIVSTKAECIVDVPMLQRLGDAWSHEENDGVPLEKALRYRQAYFQAVRTEWRSFTPEGKRKNMFSAVDDGAGQRREAGTLDFAPQADRTDAPIEISTRRRAGALPPRTAGVAPAQPARVKPEEVDLTAMVDRNRSRLEEAKSRGALTEF